jgi:hypothetical protein
VPDQKPPRLAGDERDTMLALLQYQRESLVRKVSGLDDEAARRQFVTSGTTLLWLVKHIARAERTWLLYRFAGEDLELSDDAVGADDTLPAAVDFYVATWKLVDEVVARSELDDIACRLDGGAPVDLRWVLLHLLEETARHAGHADILRELIDGQTGR